MTKNIILTSTALFAIAANAVTLDGIAAKINDDTVTFGDVTREIQRSPSLREELKEAKSDPAAVSNACTKALNALIDRRLILRAAADKKMDMQEWVVENRVREIIKDAFDGDRNKLIAELAISRTPYTEWYDTIRESMIVDAMRYQMVDKDIQPNPAAMRKEYNLHRDRYAAQADSTVRVILLKPPADGDSETPTVSTRADEIFERIEHGTSFAELAKKYSADSHAADGGLWKNVRPEEAFRSEIADEIAKLKPGEHSRLVMLDGWGFIVKKEGETNAHMLNFDEAYDQIVQNVKADESRRLYAEWIKRLRAAAYIKIYPMPEL